MTNKAQILITLNNLKQDFDINSLKDYQSLVSFLLDVIKNNEQDKDILGSIIDLLNYINKSVNNNCCNNLKRNAEFCPENYFTFNSIIPQLLFYNIFEPQNRDYYYMNIVNKQKPQYKIQE